MKFQHRLILATVIITLSTLGIILVFSTYLRSPASKIPAWNGIVPGGTTREQVVAILGEPDKTWQCVWPNAGIDPVRLRIECERTSGIVNYGYYHELLPEGPYGFHQIQFNTNGTVDYVVEARWSKPEERPTTIDELVAIYGKPDRVTWSLRNTARNAILYCQKGLIVHATSTQATEIGISEIVYFAPMPTAQCIDKFFNEVSTSNPYEGSDLIVVEDPWGLNSMEP